jgi:hypothetical protein
MIQLIVMDDTDERMEHGRPDMPGIIVDTGYLKDFFHSVKLRRKRQIP